MLRMGDEFCKTQYGNNNAYCQDNGISWLNWDNIEKYNDIHTYFKAIIHFRHEHPVLRNHSIASAMGLPIYTLYGGKNNNFDDYDDERVFAVLFAGRNQEDTKDDLIFMAVNMHWEEHFVKLPENIKVDWIEKFNTAKEDSLVNEMLKEQDGMIVAPRSIILLVAD